MVGEGAPPEALGKADPLASFDALVKDARFQERFSCFINSQFNLVPGATPAEDAAYYMAKYVLGQDKPWTEMFVGRYRVNPSNGQDATSEATVSEDPDGLGYFRSRAWMVRYAGNEAAGARIVAAYRMMQNTIGLQLTATTNAPAADLTANGRKAAQCASCHYDPWFALDKIAAVLGTKTGSGDNAQFTASAAGPQTILGGVTISNDRELVEALVANEAFDVNACRLAYKYLYGRPENACEGPAFDACVDAFKKDRKITSAVAAIVKDPTFCE
ncbi:MAG: hypothetical protein KIS78_04780 [Labilithrix sp.]|nr:hypothetical protein [Labilithrix sp.]